MKFYNLGSGNTKMPRSEKKKISRSSTKNAHVVLFSEFEFMDESIKKLSLSRPSVRPYIIIAQIIYILILCGH